MKGLNYIILLFVFSIFSPFSKAQDKPKSKISGDTLSLFLKEKLVVNSRYVADTLKNDTTTYLYEYYFGKGYKAPSDSLLDQTEFNALYYRMFVPLTYYYAPIAQYSTVRWEYISPYQPMIMRDSIMTDTLNFNMYESAKKVVNDALLTVYTTNYRLTHSTEDEIMSRKVFKQQSTLLLVNEARPATLFQPEPVSYHVKKERLYINKPNWWTHGGAFSLQMTQNYISDNWYKGGESADAFVGYLAFKANYNDKEKIQWDNIFEAKLGISSAPSDTCHNYLVSADLLRLYSKLGLQASKRWYYTFTGEINTQSLNSYKKNSNTLQTAFLAPANLIFTLGMDYKVKNKHIDFSLLLSPAAYNLRYVGNSKVDETSYGLNQGNKFLSIFGSKLTSTWTWKIVSPVTWTSRLYYFTNYKEVEAEWENTFDFSLNRYLSAQLFLHGRYDDSVTPLAGKSYFQLKELLSFGLSYSW